jgi:hypothetical protein
MNRWALMLAELPPTLQRLIARTQRISLPRGCTPPERLVRLRTALCHGTTVRATYTLLDAPSQAALHHLRTCRGGLAPAALTHRYGPIRPLSPLAADPRPQSISEQLLLLGWLLPRPATPRHPTRYLLPPELRAWLPTPLPAAPAPAPAAALAPPLPPALRAARTLLLACVEAPLPLRANHQLSQAALRRLVPALAPRSAPDATDLCHWVWSLLRQLGLVHAHQGRGEPTPALRRWLALPAETQRQTLLGAWIGLPSLEPPLIRQLRDRRGLDLPALRRRLLAWAAALPGATPAEAAAQYKSLAAAFGPLADASTHGFRHVDRVPWQPKRAAAIWAAAVHGPLAWLGVLHDGDAVEGVGAGGAGGAGGAVELDALFHSSLVTRHSSLARWHYNAPGQLTIPHVAVDAAVVQLLPYVAGQTADASGTTYTFTAASLARAASHGHSPSQLEALLHQQAGPPPPAWGAALPPVAASLTIRPVLLLSTDQPALLSRMLPRRSLSRYLGPRLAPGLALVQAAAAERLQRACQRVGLACTLHAPPQPLAAPPPARPVRGRRPPSASQLSPADCATLLLTCAHARQMAPASAPHTHQIEQRLWAALPPALHASTVDTLAAMHPPSPLPPPATPATPALAQPWEPAPVAPVAPPPLGTLAPAPAGAPATMPSAPLRARLQRAIRHNRAITMRYRDAEGRITTRSVRPLALEPQGDSWQLRAYCLVRQAERSFRLDRILAMQAGVVGV